MLDHFASGKTAVHRLDPAAKTVATLVVILATVLVRRDHFEPLIPLAAALLAYHVAGRMPVLYTLRRLIVVSPFALALAALFPFLEPGRAVWQAALGPLAIEVTHEGLVRAAHILVRFYLCVWATLLLLATTRFQDMLDGLARLRVPTVFVTQLAFLYRYLWVLKDEMMHLGRAREARDGGLGPWRLQFQSRVGIVGVLFVRTYDRSERIYWAMAARGFDGTLRTASAGRLRAADWVFVLGAVLCGAIIVAWDRVVYG
jgi:cobalt/nickel transport system permease protein